MKKFQLSDYKKGFIFSLALHGVLIAAFVFEEFTKVETPPQAQKSVALSLSSFTPAPAAKPAPQTPPTPKVCKEKREKMAKKETKHHHKKREHHAKKHHHKKDAPRKVEELAQAKPTPTEPKQEETQEVAEVTPEVTQKTTETVVAETAPVAPAAPTVAQTPPQPTPAELEQEFAATNFEIIRALVLQNLTYPALAKRMHQTGIVEILLVINEKGKLIDVSLENSSGFKLLDKSAIKAAHLLADLELPVPKNTSRVVLPIAFALN